MGNKGSSLISFLFGVTVGAVAALLFAPKSGEELRTQIKTEADAKLEMLSTEWEKTMADMQASIDKTRNDLAAYMQQIQKTQESIAVDADIMAEAEIEEQVNEAAEA
jgi:gas vesicle protein